METFCFVCFISGKAIEQFSFFFSFSSDPYNAVSLSPSATIDINSITVEDEGTYSCKANSPAGQAEDYVQVRIEEDVNSVDTECRGDTCYDPPPEVH